MDKVLRIARRAYRDMQSMVAMWSIVGYKAPIDADELRARCGEVLVHSKRLIAALKLIQPIVTRYAIRLKPDACNTGIVEGCESFGFQQQGQNACFFIAMSPITPFRHSIVIGVLDSIEMPLRSMMVIYDAVKHDWSVSGNHALVKHYCPQGKPKDIDAKLALRLVETMAALSASEQILPTPTRPLRVSFQ